MVGCESTTTGGAGGATQVANPLTSRQMKALEKEMEKNELMKPMDLMAVIYRHAPDQFDRAIDYLDSKYELECNEMCKITKKDIK